MTCLDDRAVQAWLGGELPDGERDGVRTHLDTCDSCRDLVASVVEATWVGQTAGRYRLLELVGGGAMGEVYRAEDPELGRDIAIKLVRPGGSEPRLLREAQAMARLAHPNVIRVYDVGTVGDRVFLAMELVKGRTLRAWFAEATRSWREVVAVVRQAGRGLAAAHDAELVHGDFKPDNVLVADDGRVLVTDFGLARLGVVAGPAGEGAGDDGAPFDATRTRGVVGTPAYMAPEQFAETATATVASDQFAFCVTLFEGLYGRRPFAGTDLAALRAALTAGRPTIPARPRLPLRAARVLRRGLSTAATERYGSMGELLAELDRATSRKVLAIGTGAGAVAAAVATTVWLTSAGGGGPRCGDGAAQLAGVWDAPARAALDAAFRATDLPYAATSLASVTGLLDRYREAWVRTYADTCEATHVRAEQSAALLDLRMHCLRRRRQDVKALVDTLRAGRPEVLRDGVAAVSALPPVDDCADVASLQETEGLPADRAARARVQALEAELATCRALLAAGQYAAGKTCAAAASRLAVEVGYGPAIAEAELTAGLVASKLRAWADAEGALTRALLAAEGSRDARTRARSLVGLVGVASERATFEQGHQRVDHATAVIKGLDGDKALTADLALAAGVLALREGKLATAAEELGRCAALREELHGADDARVAEPLVPLAVVLASRKQDDEAQRMLDRAMKLQLATVGDAHPALGKTLHALAQVQARVGKIDDALATQRRAYEILLAAYGERHHDVALSVGVAAQVNLIGGRYADAAPAARRSAELMEAIAGPDHPDTATALTILAAVRSRAQDAAGALAAHQRALAIRTKALGPDHLHTTQSQVNTAMALRLHHRCEEALVLLEAARAVRTKRLGPDHPDVVRVLQSIADCQIDLGHPEAAVPALEHVLEVQEAAPLRTADDRVGRAMATYGLARALWATPASRARARTLARKAYADLAALDDKRAAGIATWASQRGVKLGR